MKLISSTLIAKILADVSINLSSGWLGVLLISPGIFGVQSADQYSKLLILNLPFAILGIIAAYLLLSKSEGI